RGEPTWGGLLLRRPLLAHPYQAGPARRGPGTHPQHRGNTAGPPVVRHRRHRECAPAGGRATRRRATGRRSASDHRGRRSRAGRSRLRPAAAIRWLALVPPILLVLALVGGFAAGQEGQPVGPDHLLDRLKIGLAAEQAAAGSAGEGALRLVAAHE